MLIIYFSSSADLSQLHDPEEFSFKCATFNRPLILEALKSFNIRNDIYHGKEPSPMIQDLIIGDSTRRPLLQKAYDSKSGKFTIHYNISGPDAVDETDNNSNGIPDYIDSCAYYFDNAYKFEVEQFGYHSPVPDCGFGGSGSYDIYVINLGGSVGLYGYTDADCEIIPANKFERSTSFIVIDNDYSPKDSIQLTSEKKFKVYYTSGYDGLKITAAHEFHHSIQFIYGLAQPGVSCLHELTSTWMEYRLYPEIKDYYQYLPSLFNSLKRYFFSDCGGANGAANGYRWSIFAHFVYRNYGDFILRRMWELIESGIDGYSSLDSAYREKNTTLAEEWCKFKPWMYFTGTRSKVDQYFQDAPEFPMMKFFTDTLMNLTDMSDSGNLFPFEIRGLRYAIKGKNEKSDDTLDILLSNTDTESAKRQVLTSKNYSLRISSSNFTGSIPVVNTDFFMQLVLPELYFCSEDNYFSYPGTNTCHLDYPFPNPLRFQTDKEIYFPAPKEALLYEKANLTIFNSELNVVISQDMQVSLHQGCRVIIWNNIPSGISSGIYIYHTSYKDKELWGKFAILR